MLDLSPLLPSQSKSQLARIAQCQGELLPVEQEFVATFGQKRREEWTAGRTISRELLAQFNCPAVPLLPDSAGCPRWPSGFHGSIAHSQEWCWVALARESEVPAIGLDLEIADRVQPRLWSKILTPAEAVWIQAKPAEEQVRWATTIFSAKEAFYKFQFPRTRQWLSFHDAEILPITDPLTFHLTTSQGEFTGHHLFTDQLVLTSFWQQS
jgi:4'-phosphopantetheinyl transferase EntD